jgi:hypothetical protein
MRGLRMTDFREVRNYEWGLLLLASPAICAKDAKTSICKQLALF